jgi:hypothetical protein
MIHKKVEIEGYEGKYFACDDGQIWAAPSRKRPEGCYLRPWLIGRGYKMVILYKEKKPSKYLVHRLIAQCFNVPGTGSEVNHIDGDRTNNNVTNLEWVTSKENKQHAIRLGLYDNLGKNPALGECSGKSKLTNDQVKQIRKRYSTTDVTKAALAREFVVTEANIRNIVNNVTWRHLL